MHVIGQNWQSLVGISDLVRVRLNLLNRMKFVQRRATTSKSKLPLESFAEIKEQVLSDVVSTVEFMEIPAELILN